MFLIYFFAALLAALVIMLLPPGVFASILNVGRRGTAALMRFGKVALAIILSMFMLPLVACDRVERKPDPASTTTPTPVDGNQVERDIGGPCGDGTVLKPGEHCK